MKKVSLIFPVYNVAFCVENSLLSALSQTYENIEYVIIDDRGEDDSMKIVYRSCNNYPQKNIKIIDHGVNKGLGATRNTGIKYASGDYILFMDSDDILEKTAIQQFIDSLDDDYDMVVGSYVRKVQTKEYPLHLKNEVLDREILYHYLVGKKYYPQVWNKLYKLSFIKENSLSFIEKCNHEDNPFTFYFSACNPKVRILATITYQWIFRTESVTSVYREKNVEDLLSGYKFMCDVARKFSISDLYVIRYLNNFRLFPLWLLLKRIVISKQENTLLMGLMEPVSSFESINQLRMPFKEKLKFMIFYLPFSLKKMILKIISCTQNV
ncbi:glycosyltransferase family 2 protein [Parabacteroides chinchillae]|uniref:Glycosyltransferase involved in cell wall bisynthesis n=1 Tax=Parabacteroides chinchillae TaxID=871327 RepID=A0A8G2BX47_9BACT|nr:glycosyltransferase family 2 protein [Parabacteroides chinchillae]SEF98952.1 Glycosyltransferase involved in cell wall bisynthesis [Parabacteroides chinchillae]